MQTESIISTLLAAAAFLKRPAQEMVPQLLKDAYEGVKSYLRRKLEPNPDALDALDLATEKPESLIRKALFVEESVPANLAGDAELARLIDQLAALLPHSAGALSPSVQVNGHSNRVLVAGRDLINTTKHVHRNAITPDERHLSVEQREQVRAVIGELADRMADEEGRPNYAGAHRVLQHRFKVSSYLLLPREQFAEVLAFLKQQRAIHRSRLQRRNPVAYQNDYFRAVFSGARELGWDGKRVYQFAAEALGLSQPVTSLKQLGPVQLKSLAEAMQRQTRQARQKTG